MGASTRPLPKTKPRLAYSSVTLGIALRSVARQSAMSFSSFCTVGSASLATIPTVGSGPYTYMRAVVTRNGPALAFHFSVSTCSRGCAHVDLNTEVHGTNWGDAADRAADLVYYKSTSGGILCVRSQSPGFSLDDLLIPPSFLKCYRDRVYSPRPLPIHAGDAVMAISGHTTDQAVIATMTVGTVLGVLAVAARLFTRIVIVRKAGWDDAIICAGCVSLLGHCLTWISH